MKTNHIIFALMTVLLFIVVSIFCGCNEPKMKSAWRDREITVDGKSAEWQGCNQYYDEDTRTLVGILNDESHLYILLSINNRMIKRQIMGFGLTVWFDPEGGKEKTLGIRFPVGMPHYMRSSMRGSRHGEDSDLIRKMFENPKMELQLLGPDEHEQKTILFTDIMSYGIDVKVDQTERTLVYELKIPLTQNRQIRYAVRTDVAKRIGIGFETGKPDQEEMEELSGKRDGGSGGRGGGRGGMGRGHGGTGGGERQEGVAGRHGGKMPESFELWTRVQLAKT